MLLLHISKYVANGLIYILSWQFANESQWLQGNRPSLVGLRRPFTRFGEYHKHVLKIRKEGIFRNLFVSSSKSFLLMAMHL